MTLWVQLAGAVLILGAVAIGAYQRGRMDCTADYQAQQLDQIEAGQKLDAERRRLAVERDELARQLEEEAHADPVVVHQCLGSDRVRRLNALD